MPEIIKLVIIGIGGVGKSALTIQYISNKFIEDYDPTLEDSYRKHIVIDNMPIILDIYDTAGQEDFFSVRDSYIRSGHGFLCVYSVTDKKSFDESINLYEHALRVKDLDMVPFMLVGNKCDLEDSREVSYDEGLNLANDIKCQFKETSAKNMYNVKEAFITLITTTLNNRYKSNSTNANDHEQQIIKSHNKICKLF